MFILPFFSLSQFFFIAGFIGALTYQVLWVFRTFLKPKLQRRVPRRTTAPSNTKSTHFIKDIQHKHSTLPHESAEWVNVFLAKFYADFFNTAAFKYYFYTQYVRTLFNFRRTVLGYVIYKSDLQSFFTGTEMPHIKNLCVPYHSSEHSSVTLTMDFDWEPQLQGIGVVSTIFGVDLVLRGELKSLSGTLMLEYNPDTYSYSFIRKPAVDMSARMLINGWEFPVANWAVTWLLNSIWLKKNMLPRTRTVWHRNKPLMPPYPWEVSHDPELLYRWPKPANAKYDPEDTDCE